MSPPTDDGTCGQQEAQGPGIARILAQTVVFGCLFVVAGVVFCGIYALVWLYRR